MDLIKSILSNIFTPNKLHNDYKLLCTEINVPSIPAVNVMKDYIMNKPEIFVNQDLYRKFGKPDNYTDLLNHLISNYDANSQVDDSIIQIVTKNKTYINKNYQLYIFNILHSKIYDNTDLMCKIFPIMFDIDLPVEINNIHNNIRKLTSYHIKLFKILDRCDIDITNINKK